MQRTINPVHQFIVLSAVPVPGGCNMEFNTEIAPYMHVQTRDTMVIVDMQLASEPFNDTVRPICEKHQVDVTMYQTFLTEQDFSEKGYFAAIESMLIVQDIQTNGFKVLDIIFFSFFLFLLLVGNEI